MAKNEFYSLRFLDTMDIAIYKIRTVPRGWGKKKALKEHKRRAKHGK
jgi:hypothetical protein